jgi:hypothetical protein
MWVMLAFPAKNKRNDAGRKVLLIAEGIFKTETILIV